MLGKFVFLLLGIWSVNDVAAIDCNFTFVESGSTNVTSKVVQDKTIAAQAEAARIFNCNQNEGDDLEFIFVNASAKPGSVGNRFNSHETYDLQETSCLSSKRFITPSALNNVHNQLVMLNVAFVRRIQITECRSLRESCNEQAYTNGNYRHICWQEYVVIKLSAIRNGAVYDEDFYYPSNCSCRFARVTRRSRSRKTKTF